MTTARAKTISIEGSRSPASFTSAVMTEKKKAPATMYRSPFGTRPIMS